MKNIIFLLALLANPLASQAQTLPAPDEQQLAAIEKIMAPQRKKIADVLEADKSGQYQTYQADLAAIMREKDRSRQRAMIAQLDRNHKTFISNAVKAARINIAELKRQVAGILGSNNFTMDALGGISSESFLPPGPISLQFNAEFHPPFAVFEEQSNQAFLTNCHANANGNAISTTAAAEFDGGCRVKAWTGDKAELPAGSFQKITVSAQCDADGDGFVYALGGYAMSKSRIGLRLQGPGFDQLVIVKEVWVVAPLIWFASYKFDAPNFQAQVVFNGNFSGGNTYTAQGYAESYCLAVPFLDAGWADTGCKFFDFIKVRAAN